ncbi:hypothetical protein EI74_0165 [Mycoplasma testudineum]|uniref:YgjP-like metallopeptidase domain-containing protein n=1 Tax=Mycoplasma testudineum TaxID=244584 RepID=A0A4R6IHT1_9MOLU|nr:YgjP-like metallopeptidase domain-containing protein [Mycoplasma testudineum]TDO21145.1 hypothetical protein EI74_0165 [Mycoplasma testudineum]
MKYTLDRKKSNSDVLYFENEIGEYTEVNVVKTNYKNSSIRIKDNKILYKQGKAGWSIISQNFIETHLHRYVLQLIKIDENQKYNLEEKYFVFLGKQIKYNYLNGVLFFNINNVAYVKKIRSDANFEKQLLKIIEGLFRKFLSDRQTYWETIMKIPKHKIQIRSKKSAWATNYVLKKIINYSFWAFAFEEQILDYLIVHELSHHIHHNHSREFWNNVSKYIPNFKSLRKKMNETGYIS